MKPASIWYNYWNPPYQSDLPAFFEPNQFEWAKYLKEHASELKSEVLKVIDERDGQLKGYFSESVNSNDQQWHTLALKTWNIKVKKNLEEVPFISKWMDKHPEVVSASINILNPGAKIDKHQGDTNAIYRCHFGIEIPDGLPKLGFNVKGESRPWTEGDSLIFLDANEHYAWNDSGGRRVLFLYDVVRPEFIQQKNKVCINVRAFLLLQYSAEKWKWLKRGSKRLHRFFFWCMRVTLYVAYPIQKRTGVFIKHS